jgi:hypothetical protein
MTAFQRLVRNYIRDNYPVEGLRYERGGKHPSLTFFLGKVKHRVTVGGTPGDGRALEIKLGDIRRLLGQPRLNKANGKPPRRTLEEMTAMLSSSSSSSNTTEAPADLPAESSPGEEDVEGFAGYFANYPARDDKTRLYLNIPVELFNSFQHEGAWAITRLAQNRWLVRPRPGFKTPSFRPAYAKGFMEISNERRDAVDVPLCNRSPAILTEVPGGFELSFDLTALIPYKSRTSPNITRKPPAVSVHKRADAFVSIDSADPRAVLAAIRHIEQTTPYRLKRLRATGVDTGPGAWGWIAPAIVEDDQ